MGVVREGPGDKLRPGVYFYYDCVTPGVYTRSGVYLDQAFDRSYTVFHFNCNRNPYYNTGATKSVVCKFAHCSWHLLLPSHLFPTFLLKSRYSLTAMSAIIITHYGHGHEFFIELPSAQIRPWLLEAVPGLHIPPPPPFLQIKKKWSSETKIWNLVMSKLIFCNSFSRHHQWKLKHSPPKISVLHIH